MILTHEAPVALPIEAIHLDRWLPNLSNEDYQACARGHRAIGIDGGEQFRQMVNVESIAGNLLIQHYRPELLSAHHTRLYSDNSRAYLMHLIPLRVQVRWEIEAIPVSSDASTLRCTIEVRQPVWLNVLGFFIGLSFWLHRHLVEENFGFAKDLVRKGGCSVAPQLFVSGNAVVGS